MDSFASFIVWLRNESVIARYGEYFIPLLLFALVQYLWCRTLNETLTPNRTSERFQEQDKSNAKPASDTSEADREGEEGDNGRDDDDSRPSHLGQVDHVPYLGLSVKLDETGEKFYNLVNDRRSVRKFSKTRTIDRAVIEKCILAAGTSPSGAHTEPWTFCLIENAQVKSEIREIIEREEYINYTQRMSRQWTTDLRPLKTDHIKEYLTDAPYLILAFKQIYGTRSDGTKQQHYYNEISTSIAIGILLCALQSVGLNSLVTTPLNCGPAIRLLLDRPMNEKLLVLMPVGYAADDCLVPDLHRKPIENILVTY